MRRHQALFAALVTIHFLSLPFSAAVPAPAPRETRIPQLIAEMADDDFAARKAASKALVGIGEPALPALQEALKSDNPEVQARARAAIKAIEATMTPPQEVLNRLHETGAFVEGETLPLRDALKPVENMGLRVRYDKGIDPSQSVTLHKHGQTALELIDHLAEAGRMGFRVVPGGLWVVPKAELDALHQNMRRRLERPLTVECEDTPVNDCLEDLSTKLQVPIVFSPDDTRRTKQAPPITLKVQNLRASSLIRLAFSSRGFQHVHLAYGLIVISTSEDKVR